MKWYLSYPFIVIHTKGCHAFGYLNIDSIMPPRSY